MASVIVSSDHLNGDSEISIKSDKNHQNTQTLTNNEQNIIANDEFRTKQENGERLEQQNVDHNVEVTNEIEENGRVENVDSEVILENNLDVVVSESSIIQDTLAADVNTSDNL